ncbi:MAG: peroxidase family protein [Paracoccaceae bacterium]
MSKLSFASLTIVAALSVASPVEAQSDSQSHGGLYQLIERQKASRAANRPELMSAIRSSAPADAGPQDFFDNVYPVGTTTAISRDLNTALTLSIGSGAARRDSDTRSRENANNATIPAGFTFLGQFLDHDVTLNEMRTIELSEELRVRVAALEPTVFANLATELFKNERSSLLDLDSVYSQRRGEVVRLLSAIGDLPLCPGSGNPSQTCFDPQAATDIDQRTLALLERGSDNRLTGRFSVSWRTRGPDDPVVPDLLRCSDAKYLLSTPACNFEGSNAPPVSDTIHRALLGDGRNDENIIIAQIHLMFLLAHNRLIDEALGATPTTDEIVTAFAAARQMLTLHWQAVVMDDYLNVHMDPAAIQAMKTGDLEFYTDNTGDPICKARPGMMPHEFAIGAFRHGHSQVRGGYLLNTSGNGHGAAFSELFGNQLIHIERAVDFRHFFDQVRQTEPTTSSTVAFTPSQAIDTVLSPPLARLMRPSIPINHVGDSVAGNLAGRNLARVGDDEILLEAEPAEVAIRPIRLLRGLEVANQMLANEIAVTPLTDADVASIDWSNLPESVMATPDQLALLNGLTAADLPLWVYVLAEAQLQEGGEKLGTVGATIIGETVVGLMRCDPNGIFAQQTDFEPTMYATTGAVDPGRYLMSDLINFARE